MIRCFPFEPHQAMKVRCHLLLVYILFFLQYKKGLKRLSLTLKLLGSHPLTCPPPSSSFPHSFFFSLSQVPISIYPPIPLFLFFSSPFITSYSQLSPSPILPLLSLPSLSSHFPMSLPSRFSPSHILIPLAFLFPLCHAFGNTTVSGSSGLFSD